MFTEREIDINKEGLITMLKLIAVIAITVK